VHYNPKSSEAEAFKVLRTNLKIGPGHKIFTITSSGPREGKTTILVNLGVAAAQAGLKTVLVSTDLRKPTIEKTLGIDTELGFYEIITKATTWDKALKSISDIMMGKMGLTEALQTRGLDNLYIITTGHTISNPSEILSSENLKSLVEDLKNNFDVVLFDSPPVLPLSDALLLSSLCDGVIIVYEISRTSREALMRTKSQLEGYGAKVIGIVMNQIKPQMEMYPTYPYYYSKYKYYSEEKKNKANL
jgi:capsular exopolysaccharide synthesis family protein